MCRSIVLSIWGNRWRTKWKTHWIRWIPYKTNESSAHWPPSCLMSLKKRNWARGIMRRQELVSDGSCCSMRSPTFHNLFATYRIIFSPRSASVPTNVGVHPVQKISLFTSNKNVRPKSCALLLPFLCFLCLCFFLRLRGQGHSRTIWMCLKIVVYPLVWPFE